jgi:hypothetical protein
MSVDLSRRDFLTAIGGLTLGATHLYSLPLVQ